VTGSGPVDLLYIAPAGELIQRSNVVVPLGGPDGDPAIVLNVPSGSFVSIAAYARNPKATELSCAVLVDGRQLRAARATGRPAMVDCSGVVP
jgi:hypothetical protein